MDNNNSNEQSENLQRSLLENAHDFLLSAAESVRRDEGPRSLKECVLHLANGVELLVKAKLVGEHWSLIFSNINQATIKDLAKAEFNSVDFPTAVKRLEQIAEVTIDKTVLLHVDNLRKLRNQITHFTADLDSAQTKSLVAKSMTFCVEFCEQQGMVAPDLTGKIGEIHVNLTELQEFVDARMKSISEEWEGALIWECPECWQEALVIDGGEVECKYCNRTAEPRDLAARHSEGGLEDCPECGEEMTFAFLLYNNDAGGWQCFSCGEGGEHYDHCMRCDRMENFAEDKDFKICNSCWSDIVNRE